MAERPDGTPQQAKDELVPHVSGRVFEPPKHLGI
jgi:hypothetical protein